MNKTMPSRCLAFSKPLQIGTDRDDVREARTTEMSVCRVNTGAEEQRGRGQNTGEGDGGVGVALLLFVNQRS